MSMKIIPLPDIYETIIRSVAVSTIKQMAEVMHLPKATKVYLPGHADSVPMNDGLFDNCCENNGVYYDAAERITVTYEEIAEENFTLSTAVYNDENYPLFVNDDQEVYIRPIRRFVDFRIDVEYQAPSIVIAQRWLDEQRIRYSAGAAELTMALEYHYNVSDAVIGLLKGLYDTIQKSCWPTQATFEEWLKAYWVQATTDMVTQAGTKPVLTVKERQVDVIGYFDFTTSPNTPQKASDNTGAYQVGFSFLCRYDRPTHLRVNYPLLMNQKVIPKVFRESPIYQNYQQADRKTTALRGTLDHSFILKRPSSQPFVQYPIYDMWVTQDIPKHRLTFFSGLLMLDSCDMFKLLNLESLGSHALNPYWLEFIKTLGTRAFDKDGLFEFRLYQGEDWLKVPLYLEPDTLQLRTTAELNPLKCYHVQLSIKTNLYAVSENTWQLMRRYPTVVWLVCRLLNISYGFKPKSELPLLGVNGPRVECPIATGEGTTDLTNELPETIFTGIVKWGVIKDVHKEQDDKYGNQFVDPDKGQLFTVMNSELVTEARD